MNQTPTDSRNDIITTEHQQQHIAGQKEKYIQKRLVLLLHAYKCQRHEIASSNTCTVPYCSTMKNVLQHMIKCDKYRSCTFTHCFTSRQIILHWRECKNSQCLICQPLQTRTNLVQLNQTTNNTNDSLISIPIPITIDKDWQRQLTQETRRAYIQKTITAIKSIIDAEVMRDTSINSLDDYIRHIEDEAFRVANNEEEYLRKLAETICKIRKKLDDRQEKRHLQENASTLERIETIHENYSHLSKDSSSSTTVIETQIKSSTHVDNEHKKTEINASSKQLPKHPVQFTPEDLRTHLEPIIKKLLDDKDSHPFQQPVDPIALNIPDYPIIIKHPMDISTMYNKLLRGEYKTPLEFCDDAWLMFNNAWFYNRKGTSIYKMCTKLSEIFAEAIDPVLQKLGYCCGRQYVYLSQVMFCYGNQLCCQILHGRNFHYYNNLDPSRLNLSYNTYTFCDQCFNSAKGNSIFVGDDPNQTLIEIPKSLFSSAKNDTEERETMIDCIVCTRRWHQVCALHLDQIWPEGFICHTCIREYNIKPKENRYIASKLKITDLASRLEKRVNDFLYYEGCQTGHVTIRVLAANDKICEVKPRLKDHYPNHAYVGYPYRTKVIFAFQEIDSVDVAFFGMYVQEYNGRCQAPNTKRVYISYLDSVNFFQPKHYRTSVYHEILIGYLDYVKQLGYVYAHIWACPPNDGDDYIFYRHPCEQRIPKQKHLQIWYKNMFDKAILQRVVANYEDIMTYCLHNSVQTVFNIPYFEGDFWTNAIEENIKELDQEEQNRRKQEIEIGLEVKDNDLDDTTELEDSTKQFFVVHLRDPNPADPAENDTDSLIPCELMETRDAFLNFARDKHYEFSSLRRAKFSTRALLYELHRLTTDKFIYNCNICQQQCDIHYHCAMCEDFDLCEKCYNMEPKHEHKMERFVSSLVEYCDRNSSNRNDESVVNLQLQRQQFIQRCIEALLHAVNCRDANCLKRDCFRYKCSIQHCNECQRKNAQCNICKQVIYLCWHHAKSCMDQTCQIPFCISLKSKMQKQRMTSLQTDRRRMQAMMQQRTSIMQEQLQVSVPPVYADRISNPFHALSYDTSSPNSKINNSPGKPSVVPIRTPQYSTNWHNLSQQQSYMMAQTTWNSKPHGKLTQSQSTIQLNALINRAKQDSLMDEQQQP
ncbi:unnamed protein product [Rotaria sp. Silwood1]|nr:unnamed protein product [Rotaria sp. Silwood1]CAF1624935.1 unnamed protein product [Rotaria sp. Silwood1]CAF3750919.1 unnamed protein product [Rotaria sp. Silwood1]CAF3806280.1 unnamed protein product [Rotaria sp. Silwood1]CAF4800711.1 unnamed protein product [Rotaria sp. Silwood1]